MERSGPVPNSGSGSLLSKRENYQDEDFSILGMSFPSKSSNSSAPLTSKNSSSMKSSLIDYSPGYLLPNVAQQRKLGELPSPPVDDIGYLLPNVNESLKVDLRADHNATSQPTKYL